MMNTNGVRASRDKQQVYNIIDLKRELHLLKKKQDDVEYQINKFKEEKSKDVKELSKEIIQLENRISIIESSAINNNLNDVEPKNKLESPERLEAINIESPDTAPVNELPSSPEVGSSSEEDPDDMELDVDEDDHCIIYTDGSLLDTDQDGAKAGVGIWFANNSNLNLSEPLTGECRPTILNAEIQAATLAMNIARIAGFRKVNIHTDASQMINCVKDWLPNWQSNGWKTANGKPVANKVQLEILLRAQENMSVKWTHVRGHTNILGVEMADKLAKEGAKRYIIK